MIMISSNVFETGISDFHLLFVTQLKVGFQKKLPKIIAYRDYKKFDNAKFRDDVNNFAFDQFDVGNFNVTILINMPQSNKNVFEQKKPFFMTKELHTEIMKRSRLRNNFLRTISQEN